MRLLLQAGLAALGVFALANALAVVFLGTAALPGGAPVNSTVDGEFRFYAVFWGGYGAACLGCLRGVERKGETVRLLSLLLFVGGLARAGAAARTGPPHALFVAAVVLETLLPPVFILLQRRLEKDHPPI